MGAKKNAPPEIYPLFIAGKSNDLMIKGGDFYALWNEQKGMWSTDQNDVIGLIDDAMEQYKKENSEMLGNARILYMWSSKTGSIDDWVKYVKRQQLCDNWHQLDEKIIFANSPVSREDYASKRLSYALEPGDHKCWDEIVDTLYDPSERHKIEWAIGSIVSGDSKFIQKFCVFYGDHGTGKGTIMKIIDRMFDGYCVAFSAKNLGSANKDFALEPFKDNPLVAIDQDGDLSHIEDNTRLNTLVSHEEMTVNEKFKAQYGMKFSTMLFIGSNKPVKITDSRSGIIRRLIDISPSGRTIPYKKYLQLMKGVAFEYGAIAQHCLDVYESDPYYYNNYIPKDMISATNDFYNFMEENFDELKEKNGTSLNDAWFKYSSYVSEAKVPYPYSKRVFKEELKNYFKVFKERHQIGDRQYRNWYEGLKLEKFGYLRNRRKKSLRVG